MVMLLEEKSELVDNIIYDVSSIQHGCYQSLCFSTTTMRYCIILVAVIHATNKWFTDVNQEKGCTWQTVLLDRAMAVLNTLAPPT